MVLPWFCWDMVFLVSVTYYYLVSHATGTGRMCIGEERHTYVFCLPNLRINGILSNFWTSGISGISGGSIYSQSRDYSYHHGTGIKEFWPVFNCACTIRGSGTQYVPGFPCNDPFVGENKENARKNSGTVRSASSGVKHCTSKCCHLWKRPGADKSGITVSNPYCTRQQMRGNHNDEDTVGIICFTTNICKNKIDDGRKIMKKF